MAEIWKIISIPRLTQENTMLIKKKQKKNKVIAKLIFTLAGPPCAWNGFKIGIKCPSSFFDVNSEKQQNKKISVYEMIEFFKNGHFWKLLKIFNILGQFLRPCDVNISLNIIQWCRLNLKIYINTIYINTEKHFYVKNWWYIRKVFPKCSWREFPDNP